MDAFLANCSQTMMIDGVVAFRENTVYEWAWSDDSEIADGLGELYVSQDRYL